MGFYIRKSLSVGPFRFNLSKSGIGVSAGIKGLRIGAGPRGNYVHMGRGGIYFRKTLSPAGVRIQPGVTESIHRNQSIPLMPIDPTVGDFVEIDSNSVLQMTSACAEDLLTELNEKRRKTSLTPVVTVIMALLIAYLWYKRIPVWVLGLLIVVSGVGIFLTHWKDQLRKTVVLFYNFDSELESVYQRLHEAFTCIASCHRVRHIEAHAEVLDKKYHAGADTLVRLKSIIPHIGGVPFLKTNISIPLIPAGKQTLAFLPDRLLVLEPNGVGAVEYIDLRLETTTTNFIEQEGTPGDSEVVGHTWKYVNKKGGPDKRFKDNCELPIMRYEHIRFYSNTGLNEMIQCSRVGAAALLEKSVHELGQRIKTNGFESDLRLPANNPVNYSVNNTVNNPVDNTVINKPPEWRGYCAACGSTNYWQPKIYIAKCKACGLEHIL